MCLGAQTGRHRGDGHIDVYYLSPQVLTRTNVSTNQLRSAEFRLNRRRITPAIARKASRALDMARSSADWRAAQRAQHQLDFRLCLDDGIRVRWFSGNAEIMLEGNKTRELSSDEISLVEELFRDLDKLEGREPEE
jgi:hypothetical protein